MSIRYKCGMIRLSDLQWQRIRHHFAEENIADGQPGRRPVRHAKVLEGTLWILNTGAQWHMLPQCYPNYKTVHRRFQTWCRSEVLRGILMDIANELRERGVLDEEECSRRVIQLPRRRGRAARAALRDRALSRLSGPREARRDLRPARRCCNIADYGPGYWTTYCGGTADE
jgi:transposase